MNYSGDFFGHMGVSFVDMIAHDIETTRSALRDSEEAVTTLEKIILVELAPDPFCHRMNNGIGCQIANLSRIHATSEPTDLLIGCFGKMFVYSVRLGEKSLEDFVEALAVLELLSIKTKLPTERRRAGTSGALIHLQQGQI